MGTPDRQSHAIRPLAARLTVGPILALIVPVLYAFACTPASDAGRDMVMEARVTRSVAEPLVWAVDAKLSDPSGEPGDNFGASVAIDGDTIAVGVKLRNDLAGAVITFRRDEHAWKQEAVITPPLDRYGLGMGGSVSLEKDRLVAGAGTQGFVFARTGASWTYEQGLSTDFPYFNEQGGQMVALHGETAALSIPRVVVDPFEGPTSDSAVFVFTRDERGWTPTRLLVPEPVQPTVPGTVALGADTLALGTGAHVLVWSRGATSDWALTATLEGDTTDGFGSSIALDGTTLLVGSPREAAAYVFEREPAASTSWVRRQKLTVPFLIDKDSFGASVAVKRSLALVGAPDRIPFGAAFRYEKTGASSWVLREEIAPPDGTIMKTFASSIAIGDDAVVFGARAQNALRGAAYVYALRAPAGAACSTPDTCATGHCVDGVCCDSACGGGAEDCLRCDGVGVDPLADGGPARGVCSIAGPSFVCRPALDACDVEERCDGTSRTCPHDVVVPNGTACDAGLCVAGACREREDARGPDASLGPESAVAPSAAGSGCSTARSGGSLTWGAVAVTAALVLLLARRRRPFVALVIATACSNEAPNAEEEDPAVLHETRQPLVAWAQRQQLEPAAADPTSAGGFGAALEVRGDTAVVGRPVTNDPGSAHVFRRVGDTWVHEAMLAPPDAPARAAFGSSVALRGDVIAVGAPQADHEAGAVYVFERTGSGWTPKAKLQSTEPRGPDRFGSSVALDPVSNVLVVGANHRGGDVATGSELGAVFVFEDDPEAHWSLRAELRGGPAAPYFGTSVDVYGGNVFIGAVSDEGVTGYPASVHIFTPEGTGAWVERQAIVSGGDGYQLFGLALSAFEDAVAIGSPFDLTGPSFGSVAIYRRKGETWSLEQQVRGSRPSRNDSFGSSMELDRDRLVVGSPFEAGRGAAYWFERDGAGWREAQRFEAADGRADDLFGNAVGATSGFVLVGAPGAAGAAGRVYAFHRGLLGDPCTSGEVCASGACVDGVCCESECGGGAVDDCIACSVAAGGPKDGVCAPTTPRICRSARDECDVAEWCDGRGPDCPPDEVAVNGIACSSGTCSGGQCLPVVEGPDASAEPPRSEPVAPVSDRSGCAIGTSAPPGTRSAIALVIASLAALASRRRPRACGDGCTHAEGGRR